MPDWIAPTTEALQAKIITEADERTLILTSGGRLARQLRHAFRLDRMKKGYSGWLPPKVLSFNAWLQETWRDSWPEETLASPLKILQIWEEAVQGFNLPDGLSADIQLFQLLDETYRVRIRDKVSPLVNGYATPLIVWREKVIQRFEQRLFEQGFIHPSILPIKLLEEKIIGAQVQPEKVLLIGFEFPAPIESDLLSVLKKRFRAVSCMTKTVQEPVLSAISLHNQEEEVVWLAEKVLSAARQFPLHRIGIVVPNFSQYAPLITSAFRELIGPSISEEAGNYNISLGQSLWDHPLTQAGLLPLRFFLEGESRTLLLSLFLSPYYRIWGPHAHQLAQADLLWRRHSLDSGLEALVQCLIQHNFSGLPFLSPVEENLISQLNRHAPPRGVTPRTMEIGLGKGNLNAIFELKALDHPPQSAAGWVESLLHCWRFLGFPAVALPGEEGIYKHFQQILKDLARDLKAEVLDGSHFFAWLKYMLGQTLVNEPGYEHAGIQVLGLIEARGLAFDHLFLAGLSKGSLPQPVRTFPFLCPEERRQVQGATLKSQFDFAQISFSHLKTVSPKIVLTRPEEENGDPVPPSPFWPSQSEKGERNYWTIPGKVWSRAEWLKQTLQGIQNYPLVHPPLDMAFSPDEGNPLTTEYDRESPYGFIGAESFSKPSTLSVTAVETLLACPFKFFAERLLQISPLDEIVTGISPAEKGETLHKILASITKTLRSQGIPLSDQKAVETVINQCVHDILSDKSSNPHWLVEKVRLIGEGESLSGLLRLWMETERERWEKGWRWEKEEMSFFDLRFPSWSFSVQGRIDRIDFNETMGEVCCWDYKTGHLPPSNDISKNLLAPQLPLYLLALNTINELKKKSPEVSRAGYIGLKSEGEFVMREPWPESLAWETCLQAWENEISRIGEKLKALDFSPDPRPEPRGKNQGACTYCPYQDLCTYWITAHS
jgi:ATP-dependent helicase/nuclease subunit B